MAKVELCCLNEEFEKIYPHCKWAIFYKAYHFRYLHNDFNKIYETTKTEMDLCYNFVRYEDLETLELIYG